MLGYLKNGIYTNFYGTPLKCFKCNSNLCTNSKSFSLQNGGNGELLHCETHEQDAKNEAQQRATNTTIYNFKTSNS